MASNPITTFIDSRLIAPAARSPDPHLRRDPPRRGRRLPGLAPVPRAPRRRAGPHSLTDRLLAEGIEAIADRAYLAGCEDGHHHGGAASYEDVLAWIAQVRRQQPQRAAVAALAAVEATVLRALAPPGPADTGTVD